MTRSEFTEEFANILSVSPEALQPDTEMSSIEEWDSVAYLSAMVLIDDNFGIKIRPEGISSAKTFGDILGAVESVLSQ